MDRCPARPFVRRRIRPQYTSATLKVGLDASVGAGIKHGLSEACPGRWQNQRAWQALDSAVPSAPDGTTLGGLGHTMPYLIRDFHLATTIALVVVAIDWRSCRIRPRYNWTRRVSAGFRSSWGCDRFLGGWRLDRAKWNSWRRCARRLTVQ